MGSNCQLSAAAPRRLDRAQNVVLARVSELKGRVLVRAGLRSAALLSLLLGACGGADGSDAHDDDGDTGADASTGAGATTDATAPTGGDASSDPSGQGTSGGEQVGPNFGLLTFTFYPADASGSPEQLGMAGAWRTAPFTTDDFFAARALALFFPLAPAAADALELHEPRQYEWGKTSTWLALGNGLRLRHADGDALACLQLLGEQYPVYLSAAADFFDPACAPDPGRWRAGASYDLVAYGGPDFDDEIVLDAVRTPSALTVTAPEVGAFDFPLEKAKDLALAWDADGGAGDRVVIRVWDQFGKQLAVHAADDGSYTVPGAELDRLSAGPATITIAREHLSLIGLPAGSLRVAARHEVWLYPDLF